MFKIIDRYVSGQVISTVTWSVGMLSLMLVVGNAGRTPSQRRRHHSHLLFGFRYLHWSVCSLLMD